MVKLFSKHSNLCDHNSPTLQTDRQTDRQTTCDRNTALCTKVHRAVKMKYSYSKPCHGTHTCHLYSTFYSVLVVGVSLSTRSRRTWSGRCWLYFLSKQSYTVVPLLQNLPISYFRASLDGRSWTNQLQTRYAHVPMPAQQSSSYLMDHCTSVSDVASSHEVSVPQHRLSTCGRRAFAVAGPTVWNSVPADMRDPDVSEDSYRQSLKTFFFSQY